MSYASWNLRTAILVALKKTKQNKTRMSRTLMRILHPPHFIKSSKNLKFILFLSFSFSRNYNKHRFLLSMFPDILPGSHSHVTELWTWISGEVIQWDISASVDIFLFSRLKKLNTSWNVLCILENILEMKLNKAKLF